MGFLVYDNFAMHPKAIAAGNAALGLWTRAGAYCDMYDADGWLPSGMVSSLGGHTRDARKLVSVGLWVEENGGYRFKDWLDYQDSAAEKQEKRRKKKERNQRYEEKKRQSSDALEDGLMTRPQPRPDQQVKKEDTIVSSKSDADASELLPIQEPKSKKSRKKPATPLPEGWQPTGKHAELAEREGLSLADESFKFRAHAQANDRRQADWDAAFRLWLTNAKAFGRSPAPPQRVMPSDKVRAVFDAAERLDRLELAKNNSLEGGYGGSSGYRAVTG